MIKKIIRKAFATRGLEIIRPKQPEFVINPFNTNFEKKVLISYLTTPFTKGIEFDHTAYREGYKIAEIFKEVGYNVDVVSYLDVSTKIDYLKYDIAFGFGDPFCNSFYQERKDSVVTIYYGTGCHVHFQNPETLKRILDFYNLKGVYLPESGRIVDKTWSIQTTLVDGMILKGNNFVADTYRDTYKRGKIISIPTSFYKVYDGRLENKNFAEARKNFLWFGSSGFIHKGLDLVLDIFRMRKDLHLHICGPLDNSTDKRFVEFYREALFSYKNIHTYGFVDILSDKFKDILDRCAFTIFPSASEGGCPSVVTVMGNGGLIPIISKSTGLDVEKFGFTFNELDRAVIESYIEKALKLTNDEICELSMMTLQFVNKHHSFENFSMKFREAIKDFIDN